MSNGWDQSAAAWVASMGERGDWGREFVLDPALKRLLGHRRFASALDVCCGEGRMCRMLQVRGTAATGVDITPALIEEARRRDPSGHYVVGNAEALSFEFGCSRFDAKLLFSCAIGCPVFHCVFNFSGARLNGDRFLWSKDYIVGTHWYGGPIRSKAADVFDADVACLRCISWRATTRQRNDEHCENDKRSGDGIHDI